MGPFLHRRQGLLRTNSDVVAKKDQLAAQNDELKAKSDELQAKNVQLEETNAELVKKNDRLEAKDDRLEEKLTGLVEGAQKHNETLIENASLTASNAALEEQLKKAAEKTAEIKRNYRVRVSCSSICSLPILIRSVLTFTARACMRCAGRGGLEGGGRRPEEDDRRTRGE